MTWQDTWQVKVKGINSLIGKSNCRCTVGGKVEFMTSGQVPLPDDAAQEVKDMQNQAQKELDDSGQGNSVGEAGFVEGMIPVWGSGRDLINDIQTGDVGGSLMNAGFLIWDVASIAVGVVSFGTGTAAMQGAKVGIKGAIKAGANAIKKQALEQLGKVAFNKLTKKALKKSIDDVAKKLLKTCVFACFPAGTPVHTEQGIKNIEDIEIGNMVWAYDEDTDTIALQPVIDVMINESDHTISIYTETEVIETTAIHPFYTENGWKDASELEAGEKIVTKNQSKITIEKTEYSYKPKKVYNFTVAGYHTYFVGLFAFLVHNAEKCIFYTIKGLIQNRPLRELTHNELYKAFKDAGIDLCSHAIMRLKHPRTLAQGFKTPNDILKIFNYGTKTVTDRAIEMTYKDLTVVISKETGRIITITP